MQFHALEDVVNEYSTAGNRPLIYIAGDFNKANVKPVCDMYSLVQINKDPTRKLNCLDLILTNAPPCYNASSINPLGPHTAFTGPGPKQSDHQMVLAFAPSCLYAVVRLPPRTIVARTGRIIDTVTTIDGIDFGPYLSI